MNECQDKRKVWRGGMRADTLMPTSLILLSLLICCGCGQQDSGADASGVSIIRQRDHGPIVVIFPGRSAPVGDITLGIREIALGIAAKTNGSVALFTWQSMDTARTWVREQATTRRAKGRHTRVALVGHSWGGEAASRLAQELMKAEYVDDIPVLVTIDAIQQGYGNVGPRVIIQIGSGEGVLGHRTRLSAFHDAPKPDGKKLKRHVNYYQLDSPYLHGDAIDTASENHEVFFDTGRELGHGNLDNYLVPFVTEDVRRAFVSMKPKPKKRDAQP